MNKYAFAVTAALLVILSGCVCIDYVGQSYEPLKPHQEVKFYRWRSQMPKGKYTLIGRAALTFRDRADIYHVRKEATIKARDIGADAFCVVDMDYHNRGLFANNNDEFGSVYRGGPRHDKDFGMEVPLRGEMSTMRYFKAKVLFFKKSSDLKALNKLK